MLTLSCGNPATGPQAEGDTLALRHATRLSIVLHKDYTEVVLANPWKEGKLLHRYILIDRDKPLPDEKQLPEGTIVRTPVERAAVFTTVHCALLTTFGLGERIVAVADLKYIKIPYIQQQVKAGRIADCGNGLSPVVEKIMDIKPDIIMLSPFENSGGYGKMEEIGIPIIECAEYMETSPLGRAEWMRFYGLLFGVGEKADSLFDVVDSSYTTLCQQAQKAGAGRAVVMDKMVSSVWYVPGGRSTIGQMISDAGGQYAWKDDTHSGSLSMPFESVLEKAGQADAWMFRYSSDYEMTYNELLAERQGYDQFKAFVQRQVYGCNVEQTLFYEQSPFRPDYLLGDFIQILHPDITGTPPLRYFRPLVR